MTIAERPKRRMRFFQFSFRQLFVLFLAVAVFLSIFVRGWQRQWREQKRAEPSRRLLAAAAAGDVDGAARALAAGANLWEFDSGSCCAMTYAVERRDLPILDLLLGVGADANLEWCRGQTPLSVAVNANDLVLARRLLDAGADPDREISPGSQQAQPPLHWCIENGYLEMMALLLDYGAVVKEDRRLELSHDPPLFVAARCSLPTAIKIQMIRFLVERGANPRRVFVGYTDTTSSREDLCTPAGRTRSEGDTPPQSDG